MEDNLKVPPNSIDSEQSIIASIILDKDAIMTVSEILKPEDFYSETNKVIYECMLNLNNRLEPIDTVTLSEELKKQEEINDVDKKISYITDLSTTITETGNIKHYAEIIKQKSILRKLIKASNEIINLGYSSNTKVEDVLEIAEKKYLTFPKKERERILRA